MVSLERLYEIFLEHRVVTTDSRNCPEGSIFFALKGERFDGNAYAQAALDKGCAWAVVDNPQVASGERMLLVDNVLLALQQLARTHRERLGLPVVGITGTNGKTTTKELTAAVLGKKFRVAFTQGNLNNSIGVPLTVLRLSEQDDLAVVEMGASHPGDIKELVEICRPNYGLITNVGRAHLQGFGSFEGVINTKCELYDFLRENGGTAFVNGRDDILMQRSEGLKRQLYAAGEVVACDPMLRVKWQGGDVQTKLIGTYNLDNVLAAATVGQAFGVSDADICAALADYTPTNNRSQFVKTERNELIVDAYNANPTSMALAINNFRQMQKPHKLVVLGDMGELGDYSEAEHAKIVSLLEEAQFEGVWLVGPKFAQAAQGKGFRLFADAEEVKQTLRQDPPQGMTVLVKGSNAKRLFELPEMF